MIQCKPTASGPLLAPLSKHLSQVETIHSAHPSTLFTNLHFLQKENQTSLCFYLINVKANQLIRTSVAQLI
nr:hypothetical protein Itr_chr12CG14560 [Ipomoea trifida]GMD68323.1 hypothetical protein Iba_chr12dCG8070 [Ipomoea batatas]GMD79628.1 hypothetical protein Iba_chr13dCG5780 [Ipomoea batatas]